MTIFARLDHWKESGTISPEQHSLLSRIASGELFSIFLELNILLYAGILAFVGGLGWTVSTWSEQLGDVLVLGVLTAILGACLWYCFSRAPAWSREQTASPNLIFDYVLYLGALVWSIELTYVETRLHLFSGNWDAYLLATSVPFFFLAYRFDNRFVLSLAMTSLAGWFGVTISRWMPGQDAVYRQYAILYGLVLAAIGLGLTRLGWKKHFLDTYLNLAANVLFWAVLSGVFERENTGLWFLALVVLCGVCLAWGIPQRQFSFVAYAAVYGYAGVSSIVLRDASSGFEFFYFMFTGIGMLASLVRLALHFGRKQ
jgi:hypothetical protein